MSPSIKKTFLARLAALNDEDPLWLGLQDLVGDMIDDSTSASSRPGLTADDRAFNDGRQSMGLDLKQALADAWLQAHSEPAG